MRNKINLIGLILIAFCLILLILYTMIQSNHEKADLNALVTPTLLQISSSTPSWEQQKREKFSRVVALTGVDFSCTPPCLANFKPSETTMPEIFTWLEETFKFGGQISSSNGGANAVNNAVGTNFVSLIIYFFSDATQPTPKLYAIHYGTLLSTESQSWFPENVLQKQLPARIFIATTKVVDKFGGVYEILLDFDTWTVGYGGRVVLNGEGLDFSICPHTSESASIFVYSQKEESVISLFRDLATYPNIKAYFNPLFLADDYQEISQPNQIAAISDQLKQAQCIDPKTLSRGE